MYVPIEHPFLSIWRSIEWKQRTHSIFQGTVMVDRTRHKSSVNRTIWGKPVGILKDVDVGDEDEHGQ